MRKVTILALLLLISITIYFAFTGSYVDFPKLNPLEIKEYLLSFGTFKASLIYLAMYTFSIRPFIPVPPTLYTLAGGFTFGPVLGTILTVTGATLNASISFMIARLLGKGYVDRIFRGKLDKANEKLSESGFKALLIVRSSPVGPPFDLVSYTAGVLKIPFWNHFFATMIGIIPATAIYSYFGGSITKGGIFIILGFFLIVVFSVVVPWILKRVRVKGNPL